MASGNLSSAQLKQLVEAPEDLAGLIDSLQKVESTLEALKEESYFGKEEDEDLTEAMYALETARIGLDKIWENYNKAFPA